MILRSQMDSHTNFLFFGRSRASNTFMRKKRASSGRGDCCLRHRSRTDRKSDLDSLCETHREAGAVRGAEGVTEAWPSGRQRRRGIPTGTSPYPATHTSLLSSATRPPPTVLREPSALASKSKNRAEKVGVRLGVCALFPTRLALESSSLRSRSLAAQT